MGLLVLPLLFYSFYLFLAFVLFGKLQPGITGSVTVCEHSYYVTYI